MSLNDTMSGMLGAEIEDSRIAFNEKNDTSFTHAEYEIAIMRNGLFDEYGNITIPSEEDVKKHKGLRLITGAIK